MKKRNRETSIKTTRRKSKCSRLDTSRNSWTRRYTLMILTWAVIKSDGRKSKTMQARWWNVRLVKMSKVRTRITWVTIPALRTSVFRKRRCPLTCLDLSINLSHCRALMILRRPFWVETPSITSAMSMIQLKKKMMKSPYSLLMVRENCTLNLRLNIIVVGALSFYNSVISNRRRLSQFVWKVNLSWKSWMSTMEPMSFKIKGTTLLSFLHGLHITTTLTNSRIKKVEEEVMDSKEWEIAALQWKELQWISFKTTLIILTVAIVSHTCKTIRSTSLIIVEALIFNQFLKKKKTMTRVLEIYLVINWSLLQMSKLYQNIRQANLQRDPPLLKTLKRKTKMNNANTAESRWLSPRNNHPHKELKKILKNLAPLHMIVLIHQKKGQLMKQQLNREHKKRKNHQINQEGSQTIGTHLPIESPNKSIKQMNNSSRCKSLYINQK